MQLVLAAMSVFWAGTTLSDCIFVRSVYILPPYLLPIYLSTWASKFHCMITAIFFFSLQESFGSFNLRQVFPNLVCFFQTNPEAVETAFPESLGCTIFGSLISIPLWSVIAGGIGKVLCSLIWELKALTKKCKWHQAASWDSFYQCKVCFCWLLPLSSFLWSSLVHRFLCSKIAVVFSELIIIGLSQTL